MQGRTATRFNAGLNKGSIGADITNLQSYLGSEKLRSRSLCYPTGTSEFSNRRAAQGNKRDSHGVCVRGSSHIYLGSVR
jgi:hypothetical protein